MKYNEILMQEKFKDIEKEFLELKNKYRQKKITEQEYKDKLKKLRLNDKNGKCWTIGARTGKWYFFDGKKWIESKPPTLQEGKAICISCGFENKLENEACDYCGGNLGGGNFPSSKDARMPIEPETGISSTEDVRSQSLGKLSDKDLDYVEPIRKESFDWDSFEQFPSQNDASGEVFPVEDYNSILRSLSPASIFLFVGILGFISGFIFGVFVGASNFFLNIVRILPGFLQSLHGKLLGGIVFGVIGGIFGFLFLGFIGFLKILLINVILSFFGGIKVQIDRISS